MGDVFKIRQSIHVILYGKILKDVRRQAKKEKFAEPELPAFAKELIKRGLKK